MKKLHLFFALFLALGFVACSKEQAAAKKIAGEWQLTMLDYYENGVLIESITPGAGETMVFNFEDCNIKKDEWCSASITETSDGESSSENSFYTITDEGTKIVFDPDANITTTSDQLTATIVELEKDHLNFYLEESYDGTTTRTQFHLEPKE